MRGAWLKEWRFTFRLNTEDIGYEVITHLISRLECAKACCYSYS
jgi:hypothetical protein